jgi:Macrocin-O-methyltransferase (TylF)
MSIGTRLNRMLRPAGLQIYRMRPSRIETAAPTGVAGAVYDQDALRTSHNHEFMLRPSFQKAYRRGVQAAGKDYQWHWRVHVGLWAARAASFLDGDFVECGVNRGFMSSAIMEYIEWNTLNKSFFLLDTFGGIDLRYVSEEELADGIAEKNAETIASDFYTLDVDGVRRNFSEWDRVIIIPGSIPETLPLITATKVAFAHVDLNTSPPEVAAMRFLWDRLVPGALVVMDDYAYEGYRTQRVGMDEFARSVGVEVLSLPTGQGLLIKSPTV